MALTALVRAPGASIQSCELTHLGREPIDVERAQAQHRELCQALRGAGATVVELPVLDGCPDAVFVEDTAVVLKEVAVMTRPGAPARQLEVQSVAAVLREYRELLWIGEGITLDGGDVLVAGRDVYVGMSTRTSAEAARYLQELLGDYDYRVIAVGVSGCLHLKTAVTCIADGVFLGNPDWFDANALKGELVPVALTEPFGANSCSVGEVVLYPKEHVKTAQLLRSLGLDLRLVAMDELAKAEAGVSCCSLLIS